MKLNKLINKISSYTKIDILNFDGSRLFPVDRVSQFKTEDLKNIKLSKLLLLPKNLE